MPVQPSHVMKIGQRPGRREAARVRLALPAKVILVTGHEHCQLDDLSETGARITLGREAPPAGHSAVLMVDGIEAFGAVVWRRGGQFGLCFDQPMPKSDVIRLRTLHDFHESLEHENSRRRARDFVQGRRVF